MRMHRVFELARVSTVFEKVRSKLNFIGNGESLAGIGKARFSAEYFSTVGPCSLNNSPSPSCCRVDTYGDRAGRADERPVSTPSERPGLVEQAADAEENFTDSLAEADTRKRVAKQQKG
ncbi:hypothetical protein JCM16163A_49430 [Paenibacillus sp. YK5]